MENTEQDIKSYLPIKLETLRNDTVGNFDLFIKHDNNKLVLFHRGEHRFTQEVRDKLVENNVSTLYIHKGSKNEYLNYIADNLDEVLQNDSIHTDVKSLMAHRSLNDSTRTLLKTPAPEHMKRVDSVVNATVDLMMNDPESLPRLMKLASYDFATYTHSVNVGVFASALAMELFRDNTKVDMHRLSAAFFLHDIGKSGIPLSVIHKRNYYDKQDWKLIKKHPENGVKLLKEMDALTREAFVVILQHHERHDGSGYPRGIKDKDIHPFAKICAIADTFDALTSSRPHRSSVSTFEALKTMKEEMADEFDPKMFSTFVSLFSKDKIGVQPDFYFQVS